MGGVSREAGGRANEAPTGESGGCLRVSAVRMGAVSTARTCCPRGWSLDFGVPTLASRVQAVQGGGE